jgi:hypothetical protein
MKDLHKFTEQLFTKLAEELSVYADLGTLPVRKLTGAIASIHDAVTELKTFTTENGFKDQDEEIHFFKHEKPRLTAEHFYAMEIFTIETARPLNDIELLKAFYQQELKYIRRFLDTNKFLYAYYQFDMKELDHLLFVRGCKPTDIPVPDVIGLDPLFTTCCDTLWGKFMAMERLQTWLRDELVSVDKPSANCGFAIPGFTSIEGLSADLRWTGDSINLVELAYGIWLTGQINDGNASIADIVQWFEVHFKTKLGRPYRRWQSIAKRKRVAVTKYTDEIREAILKRLDDENGR